MSRGDDVVTSERTDLLEILDMHRYFLRYTTRGLTDEQAAQRTTVSELCLGGLIKHVTFAERNWVTFIVDGPSALLGLKLPIEELRKWFQVSFRMLDGETLKSLLDDYEQVARRTNDVVATLPDLDISHTLPDLGASRIFKPPPDAPWLEPGTQMSARKVLLHLIAETSQHAGHADIIRESLDGAKSMA
jgi:hypothetical protein